MLFDILNKLQKFYYLSWPCKVYCLQGAYYYLTYQIFLKNLPFKDYNKKIKNLLNNYVADQEIPADLILATKLLVANIKGLTDCKSRSYLIFRLYLPFCSNLAMIYGGKMAKPDTLDAHVWVELPNETNISDIYGHGKKYEILYKIVREG